MISESVRIFQNIMKYHEIAYYCRVRCLNWRCKPYIYTIFLVSETAIFLQLLNHHWVCRSSARWHPPKGYRGYDWRHTIHDGTVGWSWKKSINSAFFFPNDWPSMVLTYHDTAIYWYIMIYASKSCLEGWTRMQVSVDPSLRLQFFDFVLGGEVQSW